MTVKQKDELEELILECEGDRYDIKRDVFEYIENMEANFRNKLTSFNNLIQFIELKADNEFIDLSIKQCKEVIKEFKNV